MEPCSLNTGRDLVPQELKINVASFMQWHQNATLHKNDGFSLTLSISKFFYFVKFLMDFTRSILVTETWGGRYHYSNQPNLGWFPPFKGFRNLKWKRTEKQICSHLNF